MLVKKVNWNLRNILIILFLLFSINLKAQNISIQFENLEISTCLKKLQKQTSYSFIYNPKIQELQNRISLSFTSAEISEILNKLFLGTSLKYKIFADNIIAIQDNSQKEKEIIGHVVNENNIPLAQATIFDNKNKNNQTSSDENGNFAISINPNSSVSIKYVGYLTQVINYQDNLIMVKLVPTSQNLDEVVVVGYGSQKITKVSGAIATVKGSDIEKINAVRPEEALQGRASGVNVIQSGVPGQKPTVLIRGIPSFSGVDPLIIVDGVQQTLDDLNSISAHDIESFSVLKDAAASAIYGVRGGNGVIVITTKSGRNKEKTEFRINTNTGWQELISKVQVLNARQYATIINEGSTTSGGGIIFSDLSQLNNTDWQDQIFKKAPLLNYNISAQGGSGKTNYFLGANYLNQSGIVGGTAKSNYTRANFTSNLSFDLTKKLKFLFNTTAVIINSKGGYYEQGFNSVIGAALNFDPTVPVYNTNPDVVSKYGYSNLILSEVHNPLTMLDNTYNTYQGFKLYGKFELQYQVIKNFKLSSRFGYTRFEDRDKSFSPLVFYGVNNIDNSLNEKGIGIIDKHNSVSSNKFSNFNYTWENFAQYNFNIKNEHHFDIVSGIVLADITGNKIGASRQDVPFNSWQFADFTAATGQNTDLNLNAISGYYYQYFKRNLSFFGRFNYDFNDRYLFSFSLRRDGSTSFGTKNKFGNFPAISAGWVISKEKFFEKVEAIQFLKLRASYGITGNDNVSNPTNVIIVTGGPSYAQNPPNSNGYTFGDLFLPGSTVGSIANNALRWEQQVQTNIGLDIAFLTYFNLQVDWFQKLVNGLLFTPSSSLYLGTVPKPSQNIGNTQSQGWEITLQFNKNLTKKTNLQSSVVFTTVKNLVTATNQDGTARIQGGGYFNGQSQYVTVFEKGYSPGYFYGFKTVGLFQNFADISNSPTQIGAKPGDIKFADINNDGIIDDKDRTNIGSPFPLFTLGWNLSLTIHNFDITTFLYASYGNKVYRAYERNAQYTNKYAAVLNRWTGPNTTNDARYPRYSFEDANSNIRVSDRYLEDGSFVKIKNIQLGYNLKLKGQVSLIRFYLQVKNAYTFTRYSGFDPEISGGILESGVDRGTYPQSRVFSFGIDLKL